MNFNEVKYYNYLFAHKKHEEKNFSLITLSSKIRAKKNTKIDGLNADRTGYNNKVIYY